jgi:addiction module RelE/StbE family toxin
MLLFDYSSRFKRQYCKLTRRIQEATDERIMLALADEFHSSLNNHRLSGAWAHSRSIDITGDYRVIYQNRDGTFYALAVGTHAELYGS